MARCPILPWVSEPPAPHSSQTRGDPDFWDAPYQSCRRRERTRARARHASGLPETAVCLRGWSPLERLFRTVGTGYRALPSCVSPKHPVASRQGWPPRPPVGKRRWELPETSSLVAQSERCNCSMDAPPWGFHDEHPDAQSLSVHCRPLCPCGFTFRQEQRSKLDAGVNRKFLPPMDGETSIMG
jgi:hypothetical protein